MMDQEVLPTYDVDLEEGEVSDSTDEVYTPLPRPSSLGTKASGTPTPTSANSVTRSSQMDDDGDNHEQRNDSDVDSNTDASSSSDESSDTCLKKLNLKSDEKNKTRRHCKRIKRTVMVRIEPNSDNSDQMKARFKKYDIWTAALQEEALTETMRSCDVTQQNGFSDRNVENYDFSLRYRLNGENSLKRRLSNSTDDLSEGENQPHLKRLKRSTRGTLFQEQRKSFRDRLGKRRDQHGRRGSSTTSGSDSNSYEPRCIEDLDDVGGRETVDIAREMAKKLHEDKDELLARIIEVLGTELPFEIYKETQRIEAEGGMTIKNGKRRRTPGGVFLFLLKHHDSISAEDQKAIFSEDRLKIQKKNKDLKSIIRERKVEELKKRLSEQGTELTSLSVRRDHMILGEDINQKPQDANLSNPPPSPEAVQQSPDYKSLAINHVSSEDDVTDKPSTSQHDHVIGTASKELLEYENDILDLNCGDMDLF
ncbi:phosphorylated adapter RNA export protein [Glossina fuscipes]|uniref:Phosphorylated adapter RNA export protein n=1 Tax=Glossina fuscipes TaxID=7396 RepID=A0A9C5ZGS1_9MUSC|nr:phosphorylated adapter RNA export protein [Glossina fuscipes]KAI9577823.1 hypothetical protein GQX74_011010 [Glossina fuscipes]